MYVAEGVWSFKWGDNGVATHIVYMGRITRALEQHEVITKNFAVRDNESTFSAVVHYKSSKYRCLDLFKDPQPFELMLSDKEECEKNLETIAKGVREELDHELARASEGTVKAKGHLVAAPAKARRAENMETARKARKTKKDEHNNSRSETMDWL